MTPSTPEFEVYALGPIYASVCTSLTPKEAELVLNVECPTGIESRWAISKDTTFTNGTPAPTDCPDVEGNKHYLFNC